MICEELTLDGSTAIKHCTRCGEGKSLSEFRTRKDRKIGYQSQCKACEKVSREAKPKKVFDTYPETKTCNKCGVTHSYLQFNKKNDSFDGLGYSCKSCERLRHERRASKPKKIVDFKTCTACNETKQIIMFAKHKYMNDGHSSICKVCDLKIHRISSLKDKNIPEFKVCKICSEQKPSEEFYSHSGRSDGLQMMCKECQREDIRICRQENPEKHVAQVSRRRAAKAKASPPWTDDLLNMQIKWYYAAAKMMTETSGILHHVDHIHPLTGENLNGLHVPWNLRCIRAEDNSKKTNKPPVEELHLFFHPNLDIGGFYGSV